MESFFTRFKNVLVLVAILLAQTIGLAIQVRRPVESGAPDSHDVTLMRFWVVAAVTPLERFFHAIGYNTRNAWSNYVNLRHVRQQNQDLQQQVARLRIEQAAFAEDAMQGHRLQALLAFQQHYIASTVAAQVIGTSGSDLSHLLYIDKGADYHLKPDMAVITPDGIVGKVRDVFPHTSQVLLINDQTSGAGVLLASTRILAILHGTSTGHIQITNLTADSRIKPGETVLTSGGDQIYPRGLPVGTIESIAPDPDHQPYTSIRIHPAANLSQLEEVLVITGTQSSLPVAAQKDLATGVATAETQAAAAAAAKAKAAAEAEAAAEANARSAAQVMADRLPSLHDPNAPAPAPLAPGASPAPPVIVVPHPLPTLHPDRYTPGDTPPASSLTPGAKNPYENRAVPSPALPDDSTTPATQKPRRTPPTQALGRAAELAKKMSTRSYTSRRELEQHTFSPIVTVLVPLLAILLQAFLPRPFPRLALFDLPLIVVLFFAVSRRSPIAGTLTGAIIGLLQDTLTSQPIGVNGMAKAAIGYVAASIGLQVDVESPLTRIVITFGFSILNSVLLFLINHRLLGLPGFHLLWAHELIRACANTILAIPIFFFSTTSSESIKRSQTV